MLLGYFAGCLNMAAILSAWKGFDIRTAGSGNAGASNALLTMGKGAAVATAIWDALKAALPVWAAQHWIPTQIRADWLPVAVGVAAILGHCFPCWMQFRGGKGFASLLGLTLALDWRFFLFAIFLTAVILLTIRYVAVATMTCAVLFPLYRLWMHDTYLNCALLAGVAIVILLRHTQNIRRMCAGTEIRFRDGKNHRPAPPSADH